MGYDFTPIYQKLDLFVLLVVAITLTACADAIPNSGTNEHAAPEDRRFPASYDVSAARDVDAASRLLKWHQRGRRVALRVSVDAARNRLWVLDHDHVYVYDIAKQRLIRRIAAPDWPVAEFVCSPDMVLDRTGAAFLSSNILPRLWQIDPDSFDVKQHDISLIANEGRDMGFGGLAFAADGTLFAASAPAGSLFKVDVAAASAHEVKLSTPLGRTCALRVSTGRGVARDSALVLCAFGRKESRRIDMAPDLLHANVSRESCN